MDVVATVSISPSTPTVGVGQTVQLVAIPRNVNGVILAGKITSWETSNALIATVNGSGVVTGMAVGTATITATTEGVAVGSSATVTASAPPPPPPPPPSGSTLFRSDWNTATGSTNLAIGDNGRWNDMICPSSGREAVLAVVAGSTAGWTATPNVLQVTNRGSFNCGGVQTSGAVPVGTSFYIRMYIRVEDENQMNFHPVNLDQINMEAPIWAIFDPVAGVDYNPKINFRDATGTNHRWRPTAKLRQREWYRFEWHVEFVDVGARTARIWPRIYDLQNRLVHDAASHVNIDTPSGPTLAQYYANGGVARFTSLDNARKFGIGYEGTAGATDQGRKWYYASVEIRSDTWPGPVQ
jgi:hypothetical protein